MQKFGMTHTASCVPLTFVAGGAEGTSGKGGGSCGPNTILD